MKTLTSTAANYNQPERRLTPSVRYAVVTDFKNGLVVNHKSSKPYSGK